MANELARHLRRNRTSAERELWRKLRTLKEHGHKFRQQAPIDNFVVDFACYSARLIIEVDGATHSTPAELLRDEGRQRHLEAQGFRVLRFGNDDVMSNIEGVMDHIVASLGTPTPDPSPQGGGEKVGDERPTSIR
jgi:very-short-patch-repair endonuclease